MRRYYRVIALSCCVTAITCVTIALLMLLAVRDLRDSHERRVEEIVDRYSQAMEACIAMDKIILERYQKNRWAEKK